MIIYTDGNMDATLGALTPAQALIATTDFAQILREIEVGNIPTGTGQPFPVNLKEEDYTPPWETNNGLSTFNPWQLLNR